MNNMKKTLVGAAILTAAAFGYAQTDLEVFAQEGDTESQAQKIVNEQVQQQNSPSAGEEPEIIGNQVEAEIKAEEKETNDSSLEASQRPSQPAQTEEKTEVTPEDTSASEGETAPEDNGTLKDETAPEDNGTLKDETESKTDQDEIKEDNVAVLSPAETVEKVEMPAVQTPAPLYETVNMGWNAKKDAYFINGVALKGQQYIDGYWYFFGSDGLLQKGDVTLSAQYNNGTSKTVFYNDGIVDSSKPIGAMLFGQQKIGGYWKCYDLTTGALKKGMTYLSTAYQSSGAKTVFYNDGKADSSKPIGVMLYRSQYIGNFFYYFDPTSGARAENKEVQIGSNIYYYDSTGKRYYGERYDGQGWKYYDSTTGAKATGWTTVTPASTKKSKVVYYNSKGYMLFGQQKIGGYWYCLDKATGERKTGFTYLNTSYQPDGAKTVYYNDGKTDSSKPVGAMLFGSQYIKDQNGSNSYFYYLNTSSGARTTNKEVTIDNKVYYYDGSGKRYYGERHDGTGWKYYDAKTGVRAAGWAEIKLPSSDKSKVVYYNSKGYMLFGQQKIGSYWYCLDIKTGERKTGLTSLSTAYEPSGAKTVLYNDGKFDSGKPVGAMLFGQYTIGSKKYCFDSATGASLSRWIYTQDGNKYGFDFSTQKNLSGQAKISNKWYFFNPENNNIMATGLVYLSKTYEPSGAKYVFYNTDGTMFFGEKTLSADTKATNGGTVKKGTKLFQNGSGAMAINKLVEYGVVNGVYKAYIYNSDGNKVINSTYKIGNDTYTTDSNGLVIKKNGQPIKVLPAAHYSYVGNTLYFKYNGYTFTATKGSKLEKLLVAAAPVISNMDNGSFHFKSGGRDNPAALDCIGFVMYCYNNAFGLNLKADSVNDFYVNRQYGYAIGGSSLQPGDLILYQGTHTPPPVYTHSSIYLGEGYIIYSTYSGIEIAHYTSIGSIYTSSGVAPRTYYRIDV